MSELPDGTVSFLFSDVEGSTRLLERFGERLTEALTAHHELVARAVSENQGVVFETVGDAVYAAFAEPVSCARAAVAAQRAMVCHDWGPLGSLRIRIALHRGRVERHGAHYVGPALFRAARILALAHGGQTVLSAEMTAALVAPEGGSTGMTVRDLGRHRLKDLVEAEHVHQLDAPGLPATFPPLRSAASRFDNLPRPASTLFGRGRELAQVVSALEGGRLVSLVGPGGSGKTRLAVEAAALLVDRFADGVAFVDLSPIRDAGLIGPTIASTVGIRAVGDETPEAAVARWLRDRELLLVIDNLEQVIDGTAVLAGLLEAAPSVRLLSTSRQRLRLRGEHAISVGPLEDDEAAGPSVCARLFCDRAGLDLAEVPGATLAAIEELGRRLDRLPLAVELAAARADVASPRAMLERLEHGRIDVGAGSRDMPARQRTLRTTIQWSLDLLAPDEARLFTGLAVFAGGWSPSAAGVVCGDGQGEDSVLDGLAALIDKSLVKRDPADPFGEPRYRMLETIRRVATERLADSGRRDELERRQAAWVVALAEQAEPELFGSASAAWLQILRTELPNIRLAMDHAIEQGDGRTARRLAGSLAHFWWRTGLMREGREFAMRALASAPIEDPRLEARACLAEAESAQQVGLLDEARPLIERAIAMLAPLGPSRDLATGLHNRGVVEAYLGHFDEAIAAFEEALVLWKTIDDRRGASGTIQSIGLAHAVIRGDAAAAEPWTCAAYDIARELPDKLTRSEAASTRAEILLLLERQAEAAEVLVAAVRDVETADLPDPLLAAQIVGQLGMLAAGTGADADGARLHGFCVSRHVELIGRPEWLAGQWDPLEDTLGERLGSAVRDALMAEGAGLTAEAAFDLGLAHAVRLAPPVAGDVGMGGSPWTWAAPSRPQKERALMPATDPITPAADPVADRADRTNQPVQPTTLTARTVAHLRRSILAWYASNGRRLRIRETTDPWAVLVAETMAHQTQIGRVDAAWTGFVARFPTPRALAEAGPGEALRAWQGLGYNRRAVNLWRAARAIIEDPGGLVPDDLDRLEALPGVGRYTARAVAATAFGRPVGAVDTNVHRVLTRIAGLGESPSVAGIQALADALVPPRAAAAWTHALMDLGALVCRRTAPRCGACPAASWCRYAAAPVPELAPSLRGAATVLRAPRPGRAATPFEQTARWLRGRIVDRLREAPPGGWVRFDAPLGGHDLDAVAEALAALDRDGLVVRDAADPLSARLPGE